MRILKLSLMATTALVMAATSSNATEVKRDETIRQAALEQLKHSLGTLRGPVSEEDNNLYHNRRQAEGVPNSAIQPPSALSVGKRPKANTPDGNAKLKPIVDAAPAIGAPDTMTTGAIPGKQQTRQPHLPMDVIFREDNVTWPSMWPYDLTGHIGRAISNGWAWIKPAQRNDDLVIPLSEFRKNRHQSAIPKPRDSNPADAG